MSRDMKGEPHESVPYTTPSHPSLCFRFYFSDTAKLDSKKETRISLSYSQAKNLLKSVFRIKSVFCVPQSCVRKKGLISTGSVLCASS